MGLFSVATTPSIRWTLKKAVDWSLVHNVYFTIAQGSTKIRKSGEYVELVDSTHVLVYLDQKDTVWIKKGDVDIQLNWTYPDGKRGCTKPKTISVDDNLERRVLE